MKNKNFMSNLLTFIIVIGVILVLLRIIAGFFGVRVPWDK